MTAEQRQNRIITTFVLLSLLLHLLLLLIPRDLLMPKLSTPAPVFVEVRPPQARPRERELDLPLRKELEKPRSKPAKRLAERNQVVEQEQAPEGKDTEDSQRLLGAPKPTPKPAPKTPSAASSQPQQVQEQSPARPLSEQGRPPRAEPQTTPSPARELPDLKTLTDISATTLAQIDSDWRTKYRADIKRGDTVWMDTEQDLLISFMRRFRTNIYNVWNYPAAAARNEQQGRCLLKITIDRRGNVVDVNLLESSGYRLLDEEAMRAVRQGATYGPLPRAYPNTELKIMAFFEYHLGGVSYTDRRRPGDVY
jgi:protein TonB